MDGDALKSSTIIQVLSIFAEDGKSKEDIIKRIKEAKVMFNNKKQLLCSSNLSLEIKKENYKKLYLISVAVCGSEI
jgi:hypothetical protein